MLHFWYEKKVIKHIPTAHFRFVDVTYTFTKLRACAYLRSFSFFRAQASLVRCQRGNVDKSQTSYSLLNFANFVENYSVAYAFA